MKFHIHTYGCQMNMRDSGAMAAILKENGHKPANSEQDADVVIVNTCSVREKAEEKAIGKLRLLVRDRESGSAPNRKIGAAGCMIQRLKQKIFDEVPGLDFALGTRMTVHLPRMIEALTEGSEPVYLIDSELQGTDLVSSHPEEGSSAFINIMLGCNMNCSYCIVPSVRGREWSRPAGDIVKEVEVLARSGVREVILLGQSVMAYGRANRVFEAAYSPSLGYTEPFPRLLDLIAQVDGISRIRFTSGHPSGCSEELARAVAEIPAVCEHVHLPLQSGSARILKLMRRGYNVEKYMAAVNNLKSRNPGIAITTDIIVGFPSETDEDFEKTRKLMDIAGFDNAFIFKYSPRPHTDAFEMKDDVPEEEKLRRNKLLLADQDRRVTEINNRLIGQEVEVLVEGVSKRNNRRMSGRTRSNKVALFDRTSETREGELIRMKVERSTPSALYCVPAENLHPVETSSCESIIRGDL
ncbi:MAG: tRNA (N6-isopentenyl adenosine(37)-C2)-methylthiotransferase MiaB [Verrucomicrobiota bacterium]